MLQLTRSKFTRMFSSNSIVSCIIIYYIVELTFSEFTMWYYSIVLLFGFLYCIIFIFLQVLSLIWIVLDHFLEYLVTNKIIIFKWSKGCCGSLCKINLALRSVLLNCCTCFLTVQDQSSAQVCIMKLLHLQVFSNFCKFVAAVSTW